MVMMIRDVGKTTSKLIDDQMKAVDLETHAEYIEYLVRHFRTQITQNGEDFMRDVAQAFTSDKFSPGDPATFKGVKKLPDEIASRFSGYASLMRMKQADFLNFLVYQEKQMIEDYGLEAMQKNVRSYMGVNNDD